MTEFLADNRPLWAVLVSLLAAAVILLGARRGRAPGLVAMLSALAKAAIVVSMLPDVLAGMAVETAPLTLAPGIALHLRADPAGLLFALLSAVLWVPTSLYSFTYVRDLGYGHEAGYHASFAVCLAATMGIAFSANLLTFFLFYELLTIATYPLVIHRRTPEAVAGGRKYLVYTLGAGQVLLLAILWAQSLAPGGAFVPGGFLAGAAPPAVLQGLLVLFIVGCGAKAALAPLHGWLPSAMVAPTPVSALLHAVAVVKAGVFCVVRVIGFVFGPAGLGETGLGPALAALAAGTIIFASLRALAEDNLKRRLAYSTVGQLSYVVLGASLANPVALTGALFHIVAHAVMKITLFFCAGAYYAAAHKENVSQMDGVGQRMPVTTAAFGLAALGVVGLPLMAGFISKWQLGLGAVTAGQSWLVGVLVASAVLSGGYLFPVVIRAYFGPSEVTAAKAGAEADQDVAEAPPGLLIPLVVTAVLSLILGVAPDLGFDFFRLAEMAAESIGGAALGGMPGGGAP